MITEHQVDLISRYKSSYRDGLTAHEASERRSGGLNVVQPPINCPKWVCCLLPCINHIASMKKFRVIQPEDAEVLRNRKWIRYDAASLVIGDIIRLVDGDIVPADCVIISLGMEHVDGTIENGNENELLNMTVDSHFITGEAKPCQISSDVDGKVEAKVLYYGSRVLDGAAIALVVKTGKRTLLARLIRDGSWPPNGDVSEDIKAEEMARDEEEISLMSIM